TTAGPDVVLGTPVTDTAALSGTSSQPGAPAINPTTPGAPAGGTITFTLYQADCTTLATGTGTNPQTVNVSGNGTYGPVSFTPDTAGTFHWVASYSGSTNTDGATHNSTCNTENESLVVHQGQQTMSTRQFIFPQDKATVVAPGGVGGNLMGSIVFKAYESSSDCSGDTNAKYTETFSSINAASPVSRTTTNGTYR